MNTDHYRREDDYQQQSYRHENRRDGNYNRREDFISYVDAREIIQNETHSMNRSYRNEDERSRHSDSKSRTRRSRSGDEDQPDHQ
uniref:Uncharacterized protein n=1 Tax=Romanomermis culicivorax TaxID=13658 RepID=A0A915HU89_ROMCU